MEELVIVQTSNSLKNKPWFYFGYAVIILHLNGLKSYAGEILPYIQKGVKMVQQADKFVDNAIGEDCTYECAKEGLVCLDNILIISWGLSPLMIRTLFYHHYS